MTMQLLHGDCLEVMKTLPDKSVDLFICDLPYGQLASNQGGKLNSEKYGKGRVKFATELCDWDVKIDLSKFWEQVKRLAKDDHTPVLHFCNTKFGIDLINSNPDWFRYDLVWNKQRGISFLHANKAPMKSHEMIYVFAKKSAFYKRIDFEMRCPLSVLNYPSSLKRKEHPTEKSIELYKWLIERYCPTGGSVLDPTAGSFNSIHASHELGMNSIGIEMDKDFFDKAVARLTPTNEIVEQ